MFTYVDVESVKSLNDGDRSVLSGMKVHVRLDLQDAVELTFESCGQRTGADRLGAYVESLNTFVNATGNVNVEVAFRCYERYVTACIKGAIKHDNDFGKPVSFCSENGITVTMASGEPIEGLLANYQHKDWWTRPFFQTDIAELPAKTLSLLWKTELAYYQMLPVVGPVFRTDLAGSPEGISIRISSHQGGHNRCEAFAFVLSGGDNPFELMISNVDKALQVLDYPVLPRERKKYPEILDYLGWCSWDAFYQKVNEEGLLTKAAEFQEMSLPVRWAMIDDGWSNTTDGKLNTFEADTVKFPQGLAHAVSELKERFGIRWVGVWHTIVGYWGGIHPDSEIAKEFREYVFRTNKGSLIPYPDPAKGFGFWHAWHSFLRKQGIDFVKVDSQSAVNNYLKYHSAVGESAAAAHQALEASVALHFNDTIINCMGMSAENIWHRPKSAVSRNSDDFVPQDKDGFKEHALQNAYNSYFHGPFYWGDWDMYWTKNHDDVQNAVLRSISGGPIYFSDAIGQTDAEKIWPLIYNDGKIIRCERTANPTLDCLMLDPTEAAVPLKLWNTAGGSGVVAAFHVSKQHEVVEGSIGLANVPVSNITSAVERYVLFEHFSRECAVLEAKQRQSIRLADGESALYVMVPVQGAVTPIGLINKYISTDAILRQWKTARSTFVTLREGGAFAFAAEGKVAEVLVNGQPVDAIASGNYLYEVDCRDHTNEITVEVVRG